MRILFFGTPEFAATSLREIVKSGFNVVAVVTSPDKPAGRGRQLSSSAVKQAALELALPILQPTNLKSAEFKAELDNLNVDLGVVIAFRMLPESVWSAPKMGTVNLHASLLPQYRGAAPIQHAILNGESKTGVTTFFLQHEIDTGNIIAQKEVDILKSDNGGSLHDKLMNVGAQLMVDTLYKIQAEGKEIKTFPQTTSSDLKLAHKISKEFCEINFHESTVIEVLNKIRAFSPYPGAWTNSPWGSMKIFDAEISSFTNVQHFEIKDRQLVCCCKDGCIVIKQLQIAGKSSMKVADFLNGLKK